MKDLISLKFFWRLYIEIGSVQTGTQKAQYIMCGNSTITMVTYSQVTWIFLTAKSMQVSSIGTSLNI